MEESPEQILARLARYSDSLKRVRPSPLGNSHPMPAAPVARWHGRRRDEFIPGLPRRRPIVEAAGMVVGMGACVVAILAFMSFGTTLAMTLVIAMIVAGAVATWWRIPLALCWTCGAIVGAVLVLLS